MLVWGAVVAALSVCQQSDTPLAALVEFLLKLRQKGWHPADVHSIEQCVLELLRWKKDQQVTERTSSPLPIQLAIRPNLTAQQTA